MTPQERITEEVRALEAMDLEGLRTVWRRLYGRPPKLRSTDLLRHILAWRMQAEVLGGLDPKVRQALKRAGTGPAPRAGLAEGARISRVWKGRRYDVETVESGFRFEGKTYSSLSEIAREITGARWNGPRFFGLRSKEAA